MIRHYFKVLRLKFYIFRHNTDNKSEQVEFEIYLPNKNFKKTLPGVPPIYHVVLLNSDNNKVPNLQDFIKTTKIIDKNTLLIYAYVDNGNVLFYSFKHLNDWMISLTRISGFKGSKIELGFINTIFFDILFSQDAMRFISHINVNIIL